MCFLIKQLKNNNGVVRIAIYNSADTFVQPGKIFAVCDSQSPLQNRTARLVCRLEPGQYAAAMYHDENDNGKLDTHFIKLPREGYGFSNNARLSFGPPRYEDAVFSVSEDMEQGITLQY
ncbi:MAG: DUF2141 domain-containing protein [bacterium]